MFSIGALCGFTLKPNPPAPPPCPVCPKQEPCDFNITGAIKNEAKDLLGFNVKKLVSIEFNGIEVMNGYMSNTNNAELIGSYKGIETTAKCAGANPIICNVSYKNKTNQLTFNEK